MNKHIKIIAGHIFPDNSSAADRINSYIKHISQYANVSVVYISFGAHDNQKTIEYFKPIDNVSLHPVFYKEKFFKSFVIRSIREFLLAKKLVRKANSIKSDAALFSFPPLFMVYVGAMFLKGKKKTVLDVRDLTWRSIIEEDGFVYKFIGGIFEWFGIQSVKKFRNIVTVSSGQQTYFEKHNVKNPITVIYNGITQDRMEALANLSKEKHPRNKFIISYAGRVGIPQHLITFVNVAEELKVNEHIEFRIAGKGGQYKYIQTEVEKRQLKNVKLFYDLNWEQLCNFYKETDVLYAQLKDAPSLRMAIPFKIFEYASTTKPIIYGGVGEVSRVLEKLEQIEHIEPENVEALKNAVVKLYETRNVLETNTNPQILKKLFTRDQQLKKIDAIFESL